MKKNAIPLLKLCLKVNYLVNTSEQSETIFFIKVHFCPLFNFKYSLFSSHENVAHFVLSHPLKHV